MTDSSPARRMFQTPFRPIALKRIEERKEKMYEEKLCPPRGCGNGTICRDGHPGVYRDAGWLGMRVPSKEGTPDFSGCMCRAWVPEKISEKMCTLSIENRKECVLEKNVDTPDEARLFCAKCEFYKDINIVPVPAHCIHCGRHPDRSPRTMSVARRPGVSFGADTRFCDDRSWILAGVVLLVDAGPG